MTDVTVRLTPKKPTWSAARAEIEKIERDNPRNYKLKFVIEECYSAADDDNTQGDKIYQFGNTHAVGKNVFMN